MKGITLTLLLINYIPCLLAQDSANVDVGITYEMKGMHILGVTQDNNKTITGTSPTVKNNPLMHFAIYGGIGIVPSYKDKYKVNLSLFFEERNHSGGSNVLKYLITYPRITIDIRDTFLLFRQEIKTVNIAGDMWDENFNDMLRIYNVDFHGFSSKLGYKNFWIALYGIGDLASNVGLGLHQMSKYALEFENDMFFTSLGLSENLIYLIPSPDRVLSNHSFYKLSENTKIKAQFDYRFNPGLQNGIAFGLGYEASFKTQKMAMRLRYYEKTYNKGHQFGQPINYNEAGGGFTGDQLYPLKNYYRPINQWALYTSFQENNLYALEINYAIKQTIYKKLKLIANIDANFIYRTEKEDIITYPAYNIGLAYQFFTNFRFELTGTNKHMDLDNFYQGHALSELPFTAISFKLTPPQKIPKLKFKS